ncbi:prepilin-type N-terminal cleavage/methylation domain-containing protein [Caldanaerobius fijiensis]|uniref:prepilin-type N-terminal cleavage/methylation domain-containing protein n=1 Tax=Caldanaerobius fijiensis TaxID=456330 RepID=UPI00135661B7|nr:type II secretion system protein GspG [Caldanaerobius fijiensis]
MSNRFMRWIKDNKGFILQELLVAVAIIAVLAAILLPRLLGYTDRARQARMRTDLKTMATVVTAYAADEGKGQYPISSNDSTISNSIAAILQSRGIKWTGDANGIKDPWGNPYLYKQTVIQETSSTTDNSNNNRYIVTIDYIKQHGYYMNMNGSDTYTLTFELPLSVGNVNVISNYPATDMATGNTVNSMDLMVNNINGSNYLKLTITYMKDNQTNITSLMLLSTDTAQSMFFLNPKPDTYLSFDKNVLNYIVSP